MEEEHKTVLKDVFGDSSDSEDYEQLGQVQPTLFPDSSNEGRSQSLSGINPSWEHVTGINGLWLCTDFLSPHQQSSLLSAIQNEGWFTEASHNQAMRFGDLQAWAAQLSNTIRELVHFSDFVSETSGDDKDIFIFPSDLFWREPLFDQLIVNMYQPGEGICAHVDLMRFEDGIAIVSLESSCVMHFTPVEGGNGNSGKESTKIPVYLTPGSLVLMWGEARYQWKHEINRKPGFQNWQGQDIQQQKRTSITLRKLCHNDE